MQYEWDWHEGLAVEDGVVIDLVIVQLHLRQTMIMTMTMIRTLMNAITTGAGIAEKPVPTF